MKRQEKFWISSLQDVEISDDIIIDFQRNNKKRIGHELAFQIGDKMTVEKIKNYSVKNNSTVFSILLSCMYLTIWKYSDKSQILAGVPFSGRTLSGMNEVVGMFVNVMPVRAEILSDQTIDSFIEKIRDTILRAYENQEYQFDSLVDKMDIPRGKNRHPLFNFTFNVTGNDEKFNLDEKDQNWLESVELAYHVSKFDFSVVVIVKSDGIKFKIQYDQTLYNEETICSFVSCYKNMLCCMLQDHLKKISEITVISEDDEKTIVQKFNATNVYYGEYQNVVEAFEAAAARYPNKVALDYHGIQLTYHELLFQIRSRAAFLRAAGIVSGDKVAILVESKLEQIICILSVLNAGAVYVPIDMDYPEMRIKDILSNAGVKVLLTDQDENKFSYSGIKCYLTEQMKNFEGEMGWKLATKPDELAYIMYTSGTTGKPKGVMVKHKAILRLVINTNFVQLDENDNLFQTSSIVFDASTFEIWNALFNGMTLYLSDKADLFDFEKLEEIIWKNKITVMWLSAPLFRKIGQSRPECFRGLKWLLIGGDVVPKDVVKMVKSVCDNLRVINGYGPTENTTFSTTYEIDNIDGREIPIGKPINNSEVYILDHWKHLQPIGAIGEIYVGGEGLAEGYANNAAMTADKFVTADIAGCPKFLYATGDLGYWLKDGNVMFIGRRDNQVKIRGFRIETNEIVQAALEYEYIKDAVVAVQKEEEKCLALFCVLQTNGENGQKSVSENKIRSFLQQKLPEFMIPKYIICLDSIPLNVNGKIEWAKLNAYVRDYVNSEYDVPEDFVFDTDYEKEIYQIWSEVLPTRIVNVDTNFFDAGGNSMYLIKIFEKLNEKYGKQVSMSELFAYTTIHEVAQCLEMRLGENNNPEIIKLKPGILTFSNNGKYKDERFVFSIEKKRYSALVEKMKINVGGETSSWNVTLSKGEGYGILLLMWAMVLEDISNESVNFTVYDNSRKLYIKLNDVLKNEIKTIDDFVCEYESFIKRLNIDIDKCSLRNLNFKIEGLDTNSARILFSIGEVPQRILGEFLFVICMHEKSEDIEFEMHYEHGRCKESEAEKIMNNFSHIINYIIDNI